MKKVIFSLLVLPLFTGAAQAASPMEAYHLGDAATAGCLAGAALGTMVAAADSIAERRPTAKLVTVPALGCVTLGVATGAGTGAMAAEAPKEEDLQSEDSYDQNSEALQPSEEPSAEE
jgi:hypothetical protein